MKKQQKILKVISILFIFGGVVRIIANEQVFQIVGIGSLWVENSYFFYIYKVLGAFVIFTGILFYVVANNLEKYFSLLDTLKWGIIVIAFTMLVSGFYIDLPLIFFAPDFVFCFCLAFLFYFFQKRTGDLNV